MAGEALGHQRQEVGELGAVGELVVAGLEEQLDGLGGEGVVELIVQGGGGKSDRVPLVDGEAVEVRHGGSSQLAHVMGSASTATFVGIQVADEDERDGGADELHGDEHRRRRRRDAGKGVRKGAGDGDGGVGEAGRGGEEVGAADPHADGEGDDVGSAAADAAVDDEQQTGCGHHLGQPQRAG